MLRVFLGLCLLLGCVAAVAVEPGPDDIVATIEQSRGADPDVDYSTLTRFGPWDDRNYALTDADLALLAPDEHLLTDPIPAFFRVYLRRENPRMRRMGEAQYPLSALNTFNQMHGGYQLDGKLYKGIRRIGLNDFVYRLTRETRAWKHWPKFVTGEIQVTTPAGAAESAIAINPADTFPGSERVIAGTNGPGGGQRMWRSNDGGATWIQSQPLTGGGTCCDPTVAWSSDGSKAYASALVNCGGSCGIRFYRSDDDGQIWGDTDPGTELPPPLTIVVTGADKQFLHVDHHPSSPFKDRIYLCWHQGNVQKFAWSSDFGVSFTRADLPSGSIDPGARAVGCDVTSDSNGHVYYFYPTNSNGDANTQRQIRMSKSTNGGVSFSTPAVTVAQNQDGFNYALPSMETRKVAKIVQADSDASGGPFNDSLYAIWPDLTAPENMTNPAANHSIVRVAYSRNGGNSWTITSPHPLGDSVAVDRYQPSIKVDRIGRVHVVYYDTTRSPARTAVDLYYNVSYDGAQSWGTPRRITAELSPNVNDNFEFGDYNHMDGVLDNLIAIYTDNRDEDASGFPSKDVYAAAGFSDAFSPGFVASALPERQDVCAGTAAPAVTVNVRGILGFTGGVSLSVPGAPATISNVQFSLNPVVANLAGNSSLLTFAVSAAANGPIDLIVRGTSATATPQMRELAHQVNARQAVGGAPLVLTPAAAATGVATSAPLSWNPVSSATAYRVEVATDAAFTHVVFEGDVTATTFITPLLAPDTQHFWRVRARNVCGSGAWSDVRDFRTALEYCRVPNLEIPDGLSAGVSDQLTIPASVVGDVTDMNVAIEIDHSFIGDVELSLKRVSGGASVFLIDNPADCDGDDIRTVFDDEAPSAFACINNLVPAAGLAAARPLGSLSNLDGLPIAGDWQLNLADTTAQDPGTLTRWCLIPAMPAPAPELLRDGFE